MFSIILYGLTPVTDRILELCRKESAEGKVRFRIALSAASAGMRLDEAVELCPEERAFEDTYDYVIVCEENYDQAVWNLKKYEIDDESYIHPNVIIENVCFDLCQYIELRRRKVSIVCDAKWGGEIYRSLYIEYNSPFIDLKIAPNEYLKLVSNLPYYLNCPLERVSDRTVMKVPEGRLDDVFILFPEEVSFDAAGKKWSERIKKFNSSDYVVFMCGLENREQLAEFLALGLENSYAFYPECCNGDHIICFKEWELQEIRKKYRWFELYLRRTAYRKFDGVKQYRILDILLGHGYKGRCM